MGAAVNGDASFAMQCQSCHGSMSDVGASARTGWLQEPNCQNCHTGTATANAGAIRYTTAFSSPGALRTSANDTFATNPNTPAAGFSLYRFSAGHGGLQCEACHGSTHAEFATTEANDNVQSIQLQGHAGLLAECEACHTTVPTTTSGGPHGLHPLGAAWVSRHGDIAENSSAACRACHGADNRGTVLSRAQGARSLSTKFGTKNFWRGFQVGCYACHNGPSSESATQNHAPLASDASVSANAGSTAVVALHATDADSNPLALRVVSRPAHGRAGIAGTTATYIPDSGFTGTDTFTFAAWDGSIDSNLGTVTVTVAASTPDPRVTVTKSGSGSGLVTSDQSAINCGTTCSGAFHDGSVVTLFAQPDSDARFDGWSGPCVGTGTCVFTINADSSVSALFTYTPTLYTLTATLNGTGRGVVKSAPAGIDCGEKCSASFNLGTAVTLIATPEGSSAFMGWSGACSGSGPCVVPMTQQRAVTATFARVGRRPGAR
jgi:hypothetical protein